VSAIAAASSGSQFGRCNETGYIGNLFRHESGGNPDAKPGNTTAEGLGQFLKDTWLDFLKEMHPEKLVGATEEQVLSLRKNRDLMVEATSWFAGKNADALAKRACRSTTPISTWRTCSARAARSRR
jgi:hypothetical protein